MRPKDYNEAVERIKSFILARVSEYIIRVAEAEWYYTQKIVDGYTVDPDRITLAEKYKADAKLALEDCDQIALETALVWQAHYLNTACKTTPRDN